MAGIARQGDMVGRGGIIIGPFISNDVYVNGRPAALTPAFVTPHIPCWAPGGQIHCAAVVAGLPSGVYINGKIPVTKSSIAICKDPVLTSSIDVSIAGGAYDAAISIAFTVGAGGTSDLTGYERIAYQTAGTVLSGGDVSTALQSGAVAAAGQFGTAQLSGELADAGFSKEMAQYGASVVVATGTAAATGGNVEVALTGAVVSGGVSAGVNATAGAIRKL